MKLACPHCSTAIDAEEARSVECPGCKGTIVIGQLTVADLERAIAARMSGPARPSMQDAIDVAESILRSGPNIRSVFVAIVRESDGQVMPGIACHTIAAFNEATPLLDAFADAEVAMARARDARAPAAAPTTTTSEDVN